MKLLILSLMFFSFYKPAFAVNDTKLCLKYEDIEDLSHDFSQLKSLLTTRSEYCESDLGNKWYQIVNALLTLKKLTLYPPELDENDAATLDYINQKNWWTYFISALKRMEKKDVGVLAGFEFEQVPRCGNRIAYVEFVFPTIYLCPIFFEVGKLEQVSVLMHEVTHFLGRSSNHLRCSRGTSYGYSACDSRMVHINDDRNSPYTVSVQTLVTLSRTPNLNLTDKSILESEAIFMIFNRFNEIPKTKLKNAIVLSKSSGEVYKWFLDESELQPVALLQSPARVYAGHNNQLSLFPIDISQNAYRMNRRFSDKTDKPGKLIDLYNLETPEQRTKLKNAFFYGTFGVGALMLIDKFLAGSCYGLDFTYLDITQYGQFHSITSFPEDIHGHPETLNADFRAALVASHGGLYLVRCTQNGVLTLTESVNKVSPNLLRMKDGFQLNGRNFSLLENGTLVELLVDKNLLEIDPSRNFPFENENWLSASPLSQPEVFFE